MPDHSLMRRALTFSEQISSFKKGELSRKQFIELFEYFIDASENACEDWINFMYSILGSIESSLVQILDEKIYSQSSIKEKHLSDEIIGIEEALQTMQSEYLMECESHEQFEKLLDLDEGYVQCSCCQEAFKYTEKKLPLLRNTRRNLVITFCPFCQKPLLLDRSLSSRL